MIPYKKTLYGKSCTGSYYSGSRLLITLHIPDIQDVVLVKYVCGTNSSNLTASMLITIVTAYSYFSTVTFTLGLLPLLEKTAKEPGTDVRIVNVS